MKKFKIKNFIIVAVVVSLVAAAGIAVAYMFDKTPVVTNEFTPAEVACQVEEKFDATVKSEIKVQNTGKIDSYIRLRLVSYWVDANGNVLGKASEMPSISYDDAKWLKDGDTYYYKTPVESTALTENLLTSPVTLQQSTYNDQPAYQVLEVFAEAVQSAPADAVKQAWQVTLTQDGQITK